MGPLPNVNEPPKPAFAPQAAAMSGPTPKEGMKAQGKQLLKLASKLIEMTVPIFGINSPEGKAVISALRGLGKVAGEAQGDLQSAEMKLLASKVGPEGVGAGAPAPAGPGGPMPAPGGGGGMPMPMMGM